MNYTPLNTVGGSLPGLAFVLIRAMRAVP